MKDKVEEATLLARYIASVKKHGGEDRIEKAIEKGKSYTKKNPEDKIVRPAFLSLLTSKCEDKKIIIEAIEDAVVYLKNHPEDKAIRSAYLRFFKYKGFLRLEDIKWTVEDANNYMKEYSPHHLFQDFITLIEKIIKNDINVAVNVELVKQFGYEFINLSKKINILAALNFANFLRTQKDFDGAKKIFEDLLRIRANPETRGNIYYSYGKMFLGQAMNLESTIKEHLEKLNEAEKKFREAFKVNEMHYMALVFLSVTLREKGREREAKNVLEDAEKKAKEKKGEKFSFGEIPYKIGVFYLRFKRYEEAIYWLAMARDKDPEEYTNYWKLGCAQLKNAFILKGVESHQQSKELLNEAFSNLETSIKKAPKLFQLPASKEIPDLIEECKKHLQDFEM
jgi:tetratricopeptide (TPR) repeat protein